MIYLPDQGSTPHRECCRRPQEVCQMPQIPVGFLGPLPSVMHVLGHIQVLQTGLHLQINQKHCEHLPRNLSFTAKLFKTLFLVARYSMVQALFRVCIQPSKAGTRSDVHVVLPCNNTREVSSPSSHPVLGKSFNLREALLDVLSCFFAGTQRLVHE